MMPNFFFMLAAMLSLSKPGILSSTLLMTTANGTNPWQNGCGMEMPSHAVVVFLELVGGQVCHDEGDDVADDGGEEAPPDVAAGKVDHCPDEAKCQ